MNSESETQLCSIIFTVIFYINIASLDHSPISLHPRDSIPIPTRRLADHHWISVNSFSPERWIEIARSSYHGAEGKNRRLRRGGVCSVSSPVFDHGKPCFGAVRDRTRNGVHIRVCIVRRRHRFGEFRCRWSRYFLEFRSSRHRLHGIVLSLCLLFCVPVICRRNFDLCNWIGLCGPGSRYHVSMQENSIFIDSSWWIDRIWWS